VTTVHVLPGSSNLFGGRGVVLKNVPATTMQAMKFPGALQSLKMACGENPKSAYGNRDRFPASRMGAFAGYRSEWQKAREYLAKWQSYERKADAGDAPARDLKLDTLAAALRGEILVHIHCYRADDMAMMLDLAHEFGYRVTAFHHAVEAYKIAPLLAQEGVCSAVWSDWWGFKMEAFDGIRANAAILQAHSACVSLHSDSAQVGQRLPLEVAKAVAGGRRVGLEVASERAIGWITSDAARLLRLDDRIGSLAPGKNADVVIWSADPFSIYSKADQVFIDGALVYDRKDLSRQPHADFELAQPARETLQ
jgi:imidazolonepropionase-like amidohydrolase